MSAPAPTRARGNRPGKHESVALTPQEAAIPEAVGKGLSKPGPVQPNLLTHNLLRYNPANPAPHNKEI